jgi:hypothetical protein
MAAIMMSNDHIRTVVESFSPIFGIATINRKFPHCSEVIRIILAYGDVQIACGGAARVTLGKRECQKVIEEFKAAIQLVTRAKDKCMVIKDDQIITAYTRANC